MDKLYVNTLLEVKASEEDRTVEFIASKEIVDSDGDIVEIKGLNLKEFKTNPIVLWAHNSRDLPIGKAVNVRKAKDELIMKVEFASAEVYGFADTVYKLVKAGFLKAVSIGFRPNWDKVERKEVRGKYIQVIKEAILKELSVVPIGANRAALATGKSLTKALESGIIDEVEMKELDLMIQQAEKQGQEMEDELTEMKSAEETIIELKTKVAQLELQLQEQDEEDEEASIYKELFNDLAGLQDTKSCHTDSTPEDKIDALLKHLDGDY